MKKPKKSRLILPIALAAMAFPGLTSAGCGAIESPSCDATIGARVEAFISATDALIGVDAVFGEGKRGLTHALRADGEGQQAVRVNDVPTLAAVRVEVCRVTLQNARVVGIRTLSIIEGRRC